MNEHDIDDHGLSPDPDAVLEGAEAARCPECQGSGILPAGETCPVCEGTGRATARLGGG